MHHGGSPVIDLHPDQEDDEIFVREVAAVINGAVQACRTTDVIVVRVNNWFGPRWLDFSHKIEGLAGVRIPWDLRVPPFRPSRIEWERRFARTDDSPAFEEIEIASPIHVEQPGTENRMRHVDRLFPDSALFWWSGMSRQNGRGSLMCYWRPKRAHCSWYAGWERDSGWNETDCVRVTPSELEEFASGFRTPP
jgi:hypothetical protein